MIVEDLDDARLVLERLLANHPDVHLVATAATVDEATMAWLKHKPELVFLDVELGDRTGFEFLESIREVASDLTVIFTTAFGHYALKAIKNSAFDYLLKPVDPAELAMALEKFRVKKTGSKLTHDLGSLSAYLNEGKYLKLNSKQGFVVVNPAEILYCQADWNYTEIYLAGKSKYLITQNIGNLEEQLSQEDFVRANRSLLLNLSYLKQVDKSKGICILKNGPEEIKITLSASKIRILEKALEKKLLNPPI